MKSWLDNVAVRRAARGDCSRAKGKKRKRAGIDGGEGEPSSGPAIGTLSHKDATPQGVRGPVRDVYEKKTYLKVRLSKKKGTPNAGTRLIRREKMTS